MDISNLQQLIIFAILELSIFIAGILLVWFQQRKQTELIEKVVLDPVYAAAVANNMIWGFLDGLDATNKTGKVLEQAKLRQQQFFGFIAVCGQAAVGSIQTAVGQKLPKKLQGYLSFIQQGAQMLGIDLNNIAKGAAKEGVKEAVSNLPPALR